MRIAPLALLLAACSNAPAAAVLVSYNVGLARGFVSYADERAAPAGQAIAALDADVVCLQEVWLREEDGVWQRAYEETLRAATSAAFPHSYVEITLPIAGAVTGCNAAEAAPLEACVEAACPMIDPGELAMCALENCGDEYRATSSACQSCIASNLGNPVDVIIDRCLGDGGGAFSNGHNGLMLLSRHALSATSTRRFESTITTRSVLHARVTLPALGETDVYCTHLAADLSAILAYPGMTYASFAEEQAAQIDGLLAFVDETATTGHVVVMGDMNTGLDELPDNFARFTAGGFESPYTQVSRCTYCPDNTLNAESESMGEAIDHVLLRMGRGYVTEASRILDQPVTITTETGPLESHISDHYGVRVTVR